jgi:hypothetical protein
MISALLTLAAEEAERSETPFFVAGCVFAAWAIVIGVHGLRSESFPSSAGQGRAITAVSVVLAAICMGLAVYVAS